MSFKSSIVNELTSSFIKLDLGEKYYYGEIKSDFFPEILQNNFIQVVENSFSNTKIDGQEFTGYIDDTETYHEENKYIIKVSINQGVFQYTKYIEIPIQLIKKNEIDYLKEKIMYLESLPNAISQQKIDQLEKEVASMKAQIKFVHELLNNLDNNVNKIKTFSTQIEVETNDSDSDNENDDATSEISDSSDESDDSDDDSRSFENVINHDLLRKSKNAKNITSKKIVNVKPKNSRSK